MASGSGVWAASGSSGGPARKRGRWIPMTEHGRTVDPHDGPLCNPLCVKLEPQTVKEWIALRARGEDDEEWAAHGFKEWTALRALRSGPQTWAEAVKEWYALRGKKEPWAQTVKEEPGEEPATEDPARTVVELIEAAYDAATHPAVDPATEAELWAAHDAALRHRLALALHSL